MTDTITIGDTVVSIGDYIEFKKEVHTSWGENSIKEWTHTTTMYAGKVEDINVPTTIAPEVRLSFPDKGAAWIIFDGTITVIKHTPVRKVGWWEIQVAHGKPAHPYYWNGTSWLDSTDQNHLSYLGTEFHKDNYLGPSALA